MDIFIDYVVISPRQNQFVDIVFLLNYEYFFQTRNHINFSHESKNNRNI